MTWLESWPVQCVVFLGKRLDSVTSKVSGKPGKMLKVNLDWTGLSPSGQQHLIPLVASLSFKLWSREKVWTNGYFCFSERSLLSEWAFVITCLTFLFTPEFPATIW